MGSERAEQPEASDRKAKSHPQESPTPVDLSEAANKDDCPKRAGFVKIYKVGRGELYSVQPPDEDAIWQSEMGLKKASGKQGHEVLCFRHVKWRPYITV